MATRALPTLALAVAVAGTGSGCAGTGAGGLVSPPRGIILTYHSAPLETNFGATPVGSRNGTAEIRFLREPFFTNLPLVTWGDGSIEAAAREGGIQTIHYVDYELLNVLGIYEQLTVEVSGD
jgi:hypothetical protein